MSQYDGKTMSVREARELGFIQELNRRFLHPLGLALEVIIDKETGEERIERFWDARDDSEGWVFDDSIANSEEFRRKAEEVTKNETSRHTKRYASLGYIVQPVPGME
jgi:hypothetical protein